MRCLSGLPGLTAFGLFGWMCWALSGPSGGGVEFRVWEGRVPVERTVDVLKVQVQS